jgi:hypothetical protein
MKIKIRRAKISDIPQLVDKLNTFYDVLKSKGAKDIALDENVLRGGITIEIGNGFSNPNWFCVVADRNGEIIAFMLGILEFCSPTAEHFKCVRVSSTYSESDTLVGPRVVLGMWGLIQDWAKEQGAGYFYANVHPGNQPSVRGVKYLGFKHHYTQFYRPLEQATEEV